MPVAPSSRPHSLQGLTYLLTAYMLFAVLDTCAKYLTRHYPVSTVLWARYMVHLLMMVLVFGPSMRLRLARTKRPGMQFLRGLLLLITSLLFMTAIAHMPLAEASAIGFTTPLLVAILSGPLLGERPTRSTWIAVCAGFGGVLIILRPGGGLLTPVAALPLVMALVNSLFHIVTRRMSTVEDPATSLFYTALVGTVGLSAMLPFTWVTPTEPLHVAMMVALGIFGGAGHLLLFHALKRTRPSVLGPFTYIHLVWVSLLGYFVFDEFPDAWGLLGIAVIVASGIYIALAEHARMRQRPENPSA